MGNLIFLVCVIVSVIANLMFFKREKSYSVRHELREEAKKNALQDIAECLRQMCVDK